MSMITPLGLNARPRALSLALRLLAILMAVVLTGFARRAEAQLGLGPDQLRYRGSTTELISFCDPEPGAGAPVGTPAAKEWEFQYAGVGPATDVRIVVPYRAGMSYVAGSVRGVGDFTTGITAIQTGNDVIITLPDLGSVDPAGMESGSVFFKIRYNCDANFGSNVDIVPRVVSRPSGASADVSTNGQALRINNTFARPSITLASGAGSVASVEKDDTFTRTTALTQSTTYAEAHTLTLSADYGAGLSVANLRISDGTTSLPLLAGGVSWSGSGNTVTIDASTHPGLAWPIEENDAWTLTEDITVDACTGLTHVTRATYQCGTAACQASTANLSHQTDISDTRPVYADVSHARTLPPSGCVEDGADVETTWRFSSGKAYDLYLDIEARDSRSYIVDGSVQVDYGTGTFTTVPNSAITNQDVMTDCGGSRLRRGRLPVQTGVLDASTLATDLIRVRYKLKTCCPGGGAAGYCGVNTGTIYGHNTRLYSFDQCGAPANRARYRAGYFMNSSAGTVVPAYMADNSTELWQYDINSLSISGDLMGRGHTCMRFTLPTAVTVTGGGVGSAPTPSGDVLAGGTAYWYNSSNQTSSRREAVINPVAGSPGTYEACFPRGQYHGTGSKIYFPVSYACSPSNCGSTVTTDMTIGLRMGDGTCGTESDCLFTFLCESNTTQLANGCCGTACDGIVHTGFDVERACYGLSDSDNDGCPNPGEAIDMSLVATRRALLGDEMAFEASARVNLSDPTDHFDYVYFELDFPAAHGLSPGTTLEIEDADAGVTYTCGAVNVFDDPSGTDKYIAYLTTDLLRGCGDVPVDFEWEDGDGLRLSGTYTVLSSPAQCVVEQVNVEARFYASRTPTPPPGALRLACNVPIPGEYSLVGYSLDVRQYNGGFWQGDFGCAGSFMRYRVEFCIGGGTDNVQPFPFEVRNFAQPKRAGFEIPTGMTLDGFLIDEYRFTKRFGSNVYTSTEESV